MAAIEFLFLSMLFLTSTHEFVVLSNYWDSLGASFTRDDEQLLGNDSQGVFEGGSWKCSKTFRLIFDSHIESIESFWKQITWSSKASRGKLKRVVEKARAKEIVEIKENNWF